MPKYYVTVPYACTVTVLVETEASISNGDEALDLALNAMDAEWPLLKFIDPEGNDVDEERLIINDGKYSNKIKVVEPGHLYSYDMSIEWEECNGERLNNMSNTVFDPPFIVQEFIEHVESLSKALGIDFDSSNIKYYDTIGGKYIVYNDIEITFIGKDKYRISKPSTKNYWTYETVEAAALGFLSTINDVSLDPKDNIKNILELSTAHMPCSEPSFGDAIIEHLENGCIVWIHADMDVPIWLKPIMKFAIENDCSLIHFDNSIPKIKGLRSYNW